MKPNRLKISELSAWFRKHQTRKMNTKSFAATTAEEVSQRIAEYRAAGFKPTVCMVFTSASADFVALQKAFATAGVDLIGCSSAGEIVDDTVHHNVIACLLMDMDKSCYRVFTGATSDTMSTYQVCFNVGQTAKESFDNPGILLLSGGIRVDAEQLVFGVKDGVGREVPFFGGLAGDHLAMQKTISFSHDFLSEDGVAGLILDTDRIEMTGMATSGWEGIGAENVITAAEGNVVKSINDQPALDVLLKHFGFFGNITHKSEDMATINIQYPLQFIRENGDAILRIPLFADYDNRSLVLAGGVRVGERFRFSIAPSFDVVKKTVDEFSDMAHLSPQADAVLLFSCIGRHAEFGPFIDDEVQGIYEHWKVPMIGFFTYGEIGNTRTGVCEFHNETCSLVLLHEK